VNAGLHWQRRLWRFATRPIPEAHLLATLDQARAVGGARLDNIRHRQRPLDVCSEQNAHSTMVPAEMLTRKRSASAGAGARCPAARHTCDAAVRAALPSVHKLARLHARHCSHAVVNTRHRLGSSIAAPRVAAPDQALEALHRTRLCECSKIQKKKKEKKKVAWSNLDEEVRFWEPWDKASTGPGAPLRG